MIRKAAFGDWFYPADYTNLSNLIESFLPQQKITKKGRAKGLILPHAGYIYSGKTAHDTILSFELAELVIILGTRHTRGGRTAFSLSTADFWQTPFGQIEVDREFCLKLLKNSKYIEEDNEAHTQEHSIEVQLPLLQYVKNKFKIVPIIISEAKKEIYTAIAEEITQTLQTLKKEATIIASTDLTHYEPQEAAEKKDKAAIEAILALDTGRLLNLKETLNLSMCGAAPTCVLLETVKKVGAKKAELIRYETSARASGDSSSVVGYAGIGIY
ncbi:MAG: AmmeMemoRadiSam system protein B [Candidatus Omnitrophica bacterium]|nr:AmmeMemoRadiSam system protein B [Candidatus Omnitrophota bacterium]